MTTRNPEDKLTFPGQADPAHDPVSHPAHYTQHPSGVECIEITEHFNFCLGNAIKYIWRAGLKDATAEGEIEDLKKAWWYLDREIERRENPKRVAGMVYSTDPQPQVHGSGVPYPVDPEDIE